MIGEAAKLPLAVDFFDFYLQFAALAASRQSLI